MLRSSARRPAWPVVVAGTVVLAALLMPASTPLAQQAPLHLNPVIEKLAQGKLVFGASVSDLTLERAHALARADIDFVRIEMEHQPMNFDTLRTFLVGMIDKAAILKKGNAQMRVMPFARLAPYGREQAHWAVKQGLDVGLMGILFNTIDSKEQALSAVRSMRYPQPKGSRYMEPAGLRGYGPGNAVWFWGISDAEYRQRADVWPLNPQGDLLSIMFIESVEGLKNVEEIASVPGVSVIRPSGQGDLPLSLGVAPDSPEVDAAHQKVLKVCLAHNIPCMIGANADSIQRRIKEGWKMIDIGPADVDAAMRAARAVMK